MKKTFTILSLLVLFCSLEAQISILSTDLPQVGTSATIATDTEPTVDMGIANTTEAQNWDFTTLNADEVGGVLFEAADDSISQNVLTNATLARMGSFQDLLGFDTGDLLPIPLPDGTAYYSKDSLENVYLDGLSADASGDLGGFGLGAIILEADPAYRSFSVGNVGDVLEYESEFAVDINPDIDFETDQIPIDLDDIFLRVNINIATTTEIDAYGSLSLPGDLTEDVLRYNENSVVNLTTGLFYELFPGVPIPVPEDLLGDFLPFDVSIDTTFNTQIVQFIGKNTGFPSARANITSSDSATTINSVQYLFVPEPVEPFFSIETNENNCFIYNFTNESQGFVADFEWDFGDGSSSGFENPSHTFSENGSYQVSLVTTDFEGNQATVSQIIDVNCTTADISLSIDNDDCFTVNFVSETAGNVASVEWSFGDGFTTTAENPVHTYAESGEYEVILIVLNDAGEAITALQTVTIDCVSLAAAFDYEADDDCFTHIFTNTSEGNVASVEWGFGDGNSISDENPTHTYAENGDFDVTLTVTDSQGNEENISQTITVDCIIDGIESLNNKVEVYPNPATEFLQIKTPNNDRNLSFVVVDMSGKIAETYTLQPYEVHFIQVKHLNNGFYTYQLKNVDEVVLSKGSFVKE